jgi:hypothetical protein
MSIDSPHSDARAFYEFLGGRLKDCAGLTPEEHLIEFRSYQRELERAREELAESHAEYLRGEAGEMDMEALIDELTSELDDEGIRD